MVETLPTTKKIELINNKEYIIVAIEENFKIFVMYIIVLDVKLLILIYLIKETQISEL